MRLSWVTLNGSVTWPSLPTWVLKKIWGHGNLISTLFDNIKAFQWKVKLLQGQLRKGDSCSCLQGVARWHRHKWGRSFTSPAFRKEPRPLTKTREEFGRRFSDLRDHASFQPFPKNILMCTWGRACWRALWVHQPAGKLRGQSSMLHFTSMLSERHLYSEAHTSVSRPSLWPLTNPSWDPGGRMPIYMLCVISQWRRCSRTAEESWPSENSPTNPIAIKKADFG